MSPLFALLLAAPHAWATGPLSADQNLEEGAPGAGIEADAPVGIINGQDATEDDYPMAGGMILDATFTFPGYGTQDLTSFVCSSTLIAPDVVMLAAHCLDEFALTYGQGSIDEMAVYWTRQADLSDLDGSRPRPQLPDDAVQAWDWVVHPDFDLRRLQMGVAENEDVALLFLDTPIFDTVPAVLATPDEAATLAEGVEVIVVGWGQQTATSGSQRPPSGTYAYKQWGRAPIGAISDAEFQVGPAQDDTRKCHGDSGGPSFLDLGDGTLRVVGVTSHAYDGTDCAQKGGVDTRVDHYFEWIDAEMRARCEDGTRAWCDEPGALTYGWNAVTPPFADAITAGDEGAGGCGCAHQAGGGAGALALAFSLMGLMGLRRRE